MDSIHTLPQLSAEEIRVLGALMEKSKTTPEVYPLTLNALVTACNQKTSRNPVVQYDDETVVTTLDVLKRKQLIGTVIGAGSRAVKYRHNLAVHHSLDGAELAVLCLLFLRGPLTAGEINSNAGRLYEFDDLEEVQRTLQALMDAETPFVQLLSKRPGQKEGRFCHLFAAPPTDEALDAIVSKSTHNADLENRLQQVEAELETLKVQMQRLMSELGI